MKGMIIERSLARRPQDRRIAGLREIPRMSKAYRHPAMKQLKDQQTRYAPRERRLEQVQRAEQLLGEIEGAKRIHTSICVTGSPVFGPTHGRRCCLKAAMFSMTCGCSSRICRRRHGRPSSKWRSRY